MTEQKLEHALRAEAVRSVWTVRLLAVGIVINIAGILALADQASLIGRAVRGAGIPQAAAAANDQRVSFINGLDVLAFVVTAILFLMWFYAAYRTLALVGTGKTRHSASSATGDWFIPILNLFRVPRNMTEIWHRSSGGNALEDISKLPMPALVNAWWFFFVLVGVLTRVASSVGEEQTVAALTSMTYWSIGANLVEVAAAVLAIRVVARIHERQSAFGSAAAASLSPAADGIAG